MFDILGIGDLKKAMSQDSVPLRNLRIDPSWVRFFHAKTKMRKNLFQEDEEEEALVKDAKSDLKKDVKGSTSVNKPIEKSEGSASKKAVDTKKIVKVDNLKTEKAVLIQFIKPRREGYKTISAIFAMLTGNLKGKTLAASTNR